MPSSSARSASPGVRRGPPAASIASQNAPAPRPSSTRPRLSTSRLATVLASTYGGRSGRLVTFVVTRSDDVRASTVAISAQASRNRGLVRMVLERRQLEPGRLGEQRELDDPVGLRGVRRDEGAELEVLAVVGHHPILSHAERGLRAPESRPRGPVVRL